MPCLTKFQLNSETKLETVEENGAQADICSRPQPVKEGSRIVQNTIKAAAFVAVGGAVISLLGVCTSPCMGATRSARLQWQRREAEVQKAWERYQSQSRESVQTAASAADLSHE